MQEPATVKLNDRTEPPPELVTLHAGLNTPAELDPKKWVALKRLTEELLNPAHWEFNTTGEGPRLGLEKVYREEQLPPELLALLPEVARSFNMSKQLCMQVMVELVATNHLGATTLDSYCQRFGIDQSAYGEMLREAISFESGSNVSEIDLQLLEVYPFLEKLAALTTPEERMVPFNEQFARKSQLIFLLDYGWQGRMPLRDFLQFKIGVAESQVALFGTEYPVLKARVDEPEWKAEHLFQEAYAKENAASLTDFDRLPVGDEASVAFLSLDYPFAHRVLGVQSSRDNEYCLHTLSIQLPQEHRSRSTELHNIVRFYVRRSEELAATSDVSSFCVRHDGLQVHTSENSDYHSDVSFEELKSLSHELNDWEHPFSLWSHQDLEKEWPDTALQRKKLEKWLNRSGVFERKSRIFWSKQSDSSGTGFDLELVPGYNECKSGFSLSVVASQELQHVPRRIRIEVGFTKYLDGHVPTLAVQTMQIRKEIPVLAHPGFQKVLNPLIQETLNSLKGIYRADPFAILTGAVVDLAQAQGIPQVQIRRGSESLWYKHHQDRVDPDARIDRVAAELGFLPPSSERAFWQLNIEPGVQPALGEMPEESRAAFSGAVCGMVPERCLLRDINEADRI